MISTFWHTVACACSATLSPLDLLQITPSEQSLDYIEHQQQFQLHSLLTEQRHPKTWNLSQTIQRDTLEGIQMLLSVDEDISAKFTQMPTYELEQAATAIVQALISGHRIYVYGCGATGRLAKQMESSFWRPFCNRLKALPQWGRISSDFSDLESRLTGEMTGGDRALISSLEGFEDLQLIGKLQLQDHGIGPDDVVFAITEGGETSSVIGTILAALNQSSRKEQLYFIYNNPDEVLLPLDRSRSVIDNPGITKVRLFTGPQSITGSTRMQATTSETFVMGMVLEHALCQLLQPYFSQEEFAALGFDATLTFKDRLVSFIPIQKTVQAAAKQIAALTDLESAAYAKGAKSTYMANEALVTVFTDSTERAPTFRLFPLDPVGVERKSWIQVWTLANDPQSAWQQFLGRSFRGLGKTLYEEPFSTLIENPYLRSAALSSLQRAGDDQQNLYDFSMSAANLSQRGPQTGDIGVLALLSDEALDSFTPWLNLFSNQRIGIFSTKELPPVPNACQIILPVGGQDPLQVRQHIALKMALNAHSTGVMAKLGRVVGNTMTNVNPGNLKLIGRATFLILSHVNDQFPDLIFYEEANAALFAAIDWAKANQRIGQNAEVALCIIRLIESQRKQQNISWENAEQILQQVGLEGYL